MPRANFCGKPGIGDYGKCWAIVFTSYGAMYGGTAQCGCKARKDKLTCSRHDYLEAEAQKTADRHLAKKAAEAEGR